MKNKRANSRVVAPLSFCCKVKQVYFINKVFGENIFFFAISKSGPFHNGPLLSFQ